MKRSLGITFFLGLGVIVAFGACSDSKSGGSTGGAGGTAGGFGGFGGNTDGGGAVGGGGTGGTGATGGSTSASCQGNCGSSQPVPNSSPECYCDDLCEQNNDCCDDKATVCGSGGSGGTGGGTANGTCKKFCCADSDCGSGEKCNALNAATVGTLGTCGAPVPTDGGTGTDAGPAPDAGASDGSVPPADGGGTGGATGDGGTGLPAGCVKVKMDCNPLTNAGCTGAGAACDLGTSGGATVVQCFPDGNTVQPGGSCNNGSGPWCIPTYHCTN